MTLTKNTLLPLGTVVVICLSLFKAGQWVNALTENIEENTKLTQGLVAEVAFIKKEGRFKGRQDMTRGQFNRYMKAYALAVATGEPIPDVWDSRFDNQDE